MDIVKILIQKDQFTLIMLGVKTALTKKKKNKTVMYKQYNSGHLQNSAK